MLGEKCTKAAECYVAVEPENVECRNGVCQCQFGTKKDEEKLVCKSVAKKSKLFLSNYLYAQGCGYF